MHHTIGTYDYVHCVDRTTDEFFLTVCAIALFLNCFFRAVTKEIDVVCITHQTWGRGLLLNGNMVELDARWLV
jgi:hypothetical protein